MPMEKIVDILGQWADYEKAHPGSEFEDFCRYYLARPGIKAFKPPKGELPMPADTDGMFMMAVSRTVLSFWIYMRTALKDTPMPSIESLMICAALNQLGESRKLDVINHAMMETSTGRDIINRLIKKGFIRQRTDPADKRSRLLVLSAEGREALYQSFAKASIARDILLEGVPDDDKKLVVQVLNPIQERHSKLAVKSKGMRIEEIYAATKQAGG